jgi:hypothetical protein
MAGWGGSILRAVEGSGGQPARRATLALALVAALGTVVVPSIVLAGTGRVVPDAACDRDGKAKSRSGDEKAALTVINNSDEAVKTYWLDYDGKRVFYEDVAPHTSYVQKTWLTHPWVVTSVDGECYRFLVMNAKEQTVTVAPEHPDPAATVRAVPTRTPPINAPTAGPTVGPATTPGPVTTTTSDTTSDYTWLLILGALASMAAVLIGISAAQGRLPWINRGGTPRP